MRPTPDQVATWVHEVLRILEAGHYETSSGRHVSIEEALASARQCTLGYPPDQDLPRPVSDRRSTRIEVHETTTLGAARALHEQGKRPVALNFANAHVPGGGFLVGARAQEESLCWSSGLYGCLVGHPMYAFHAERPDFLYTDYVIYSPGVPVFRGDDGMLLDNPWPCAFLTSAAPFASMHLQGNPSGAADLEPAFRSRVDQVLAVAAHHRHESLVLGAWGCGVFGNDPAMVAGVFRDALTKACRGVFDDVVFVVIDSSPDQQRLRAFRSAFEDA